MKLPIYDISINLEDEETLMTSISLVTDPAVERSFIAFNEDKKPMQFSITDEDKHCVTGVAIRAGVPIYRYSPDMGEYYVRFTKETIEDIVFKYSKMNLWNSVSLEHSGENITDAIMVEYFIKGNGKNPDGFEDVEDGSLFVTYKITNEELWDTIKNSDEINGFSVEIMANLEPTNEVVEDEFSNDNIDEEDESFWERLGKWIVGEVDESPLDNFADDKKKSKKKKDVVIPQPKTEEPKIEPAYADRYEEAIKKHQWLIVNYDDGQEEPHIRARQGFITAYGYTEAGNLAVRFWERFGDSRSASEGDSIIPDWRILLDERITSWKVIPNVEPWTDADLGYGYHNGGDDSLSFPLIMAYEMGE